MNIVQLMASPFVGGPERQVLGLAGTLTAHRTTFLSFAEGGRARPLLDRASAEGFGAVELASNFPRVDRAIREVAHHLRTLRADILCTSGYKPDLIGWRAARRAGIPVVAIAHGWTGATWRVRVYEWLDAFAMKYVDAVVCVSSATADCVRRAGVPVSRSVIIRNALDTTPYDRACPEARHALESLFAKPPAIILGAVGRLSPEKGFDVFIDAAAEILRERQDVGVVLFGDGPLRAALTRRVEERGLSGRFLFAGFRNDLEHYLHGLDLAVSSSHTEGLPVAILETMAAGVPVVATAVGGTPEVVEDDVTGVLVPPGRPDLLAGTIRVLLDAPEARRAMGVRGAARVRSEFTFAAQAARYEELFARLVPGTSSPSPVSERYCHARS
jgi:glycosyltransferase involved in cell wall biosynthesis